MLVRFVYRENGENSMWCIRDYDGNYYNPQKTKLVEVDAMHVKEMTYEAAEKWIMMQNKKDFYRICEINTESDERTMTVDEEKDNWVYVMDEIDWEQFVKDLIFVTEHLNKYREELEDRESFHDRKLSDLMHYVELYDVDDGMAQPLIDMMGRVRRDRRSVKNRLNCVMAVSRLLINHPIMINAERELKAMKGLHNSKYRPRELPELFENACYRSNIQEDVWALPADREWDQGIELLETDDDETADYTPMNEINKLEQLIESKLSTMDEKRFNLKQAFDTCKEIKDIRSRLKILKASNPEEIDIQAAM